MKRRPVDWLLEEDILKLKSGLQRAEAVEARVEAAEPESKPSPPELAEDVPTIEGARRSGSAKRSALPLITGLAVLALGAAAAYWWWSGRSSDVPAPIETSPAAFSAPSSAADAGTTATMAATEAGAPATAASAAPPSTETTSPAELAALAAPTEPAAVQAAPAEPDVQAAPTRAARKQAPTVSPAAPSAPKELFWVVAGPFESTEATRGIRRYAPDLELREDVRTVKLTAHLVRSEASTTRADAQALADQLAAFGLVAELVADGDAFRLQVGPLASLNDAEQAANLLLSLGHPARSSRVQVDGKMIYIEVGPVPSEEEAAALSRTLSDRLGVRTGLKREDVEP